MITEFVTSEDQTLSDVTNSVTNSDAGPKKKEPPVYLPWLTEKYDYSIIQPLDFLLEQLPPRPHLG